jgi:hypothetical protein
MVQMRFYRRIEESVFAFILVSSREDEGKIAERLKRLVYALESDASERSERR